MGTTRSPLIYRDLKEAAVKEGREEPLKEARQWASVGAMSTQYLPSRRDRARRKASKVKTWVCLGTIEIWGRASRKPEESETRKSPLPTLTELELSLSLSLNTLLRFMGIPTGPASQGTVGFMQGSEMLSSACQACCGKG